MLRIYGCIADTHNFHLVLLAAIIAVFGSYTAVGLLRHAAAQMGPTRRPWLLATAFAAGSAIWATHFVAMLAYLPGVGANYDPQLTLLSLVAAVIITGSGFAVAVFGARAGTAAAAPAGTAGAAAMAMTGLSAGTTHAGTAGGGAVHILGGAIVGAGITVMHYTGMAGLDLPGSVTWNHALVAGSLACGCALGAAAIRLALSGSGGAMRVLASVTLALAICADHFTGMAAMSITLGGGGARLEGAMSPNWLAAGVTVACLSLLGLAAAGMALDQRERRRLQAETANLRDLADIAVEGLLVVDGDIVVSANESFLAMSGLARDVVAATRLSALFLPVSGGGRRDEAMREETVAESILLAAHGEPIPVEIVSKPIEYAGRPHVVMALRDLRERRLVEQRIRFLAHHDPLTRLSNRAAFGDRLARDCQELGGTRREFALLAIDLDRFKPVNDVHGHPFGDLLLICVADRLRHALREDDLVARLGGDEFAVLLSSSAGVRDTASRLLETIAQPYVIEGKTVTIGASIGIAVAPSDGRAPDLLMNNADVALYAAKAAGRGTMCFFQHAMGEQLRETRQMESDMRGALANEGFMVFYQPLIDVGRGQVCGFEALLRWPHATRGMIPPGEFIALAESNGLVVPLGAWVLRRAMTDAAGWPPHLKVAINLSTLQFGHHLVQTVRSALDSAGLAPDRLELEITETTLLKDTDAVLAALHELRSHGIRIVLDDFGSGYSSLSYLLRFPFDKIKIDRSFVAGVVDRVESAAIVRAVCGLARSIGIGLLAEGVETREQFDWLRAENFDEVQGHLFSVARPAEDVADMVRAAIPRDAPGLRDAPSLRDAPIPRDAPNPRDEQGLHDEQSLRDEQGLVARRA